MKRLRTDKRKDSGRLFKAALLTGALSCVLGFVGCAPEEETLDPETSITVGLLLPFTGPSAATATNFEKAVLLAAERVNDAGGIQGKTLRIVARDTHSDVKRSIGSVEELIDEGAVAVIGPESPEIAEAIRDRLNDARVPLVSPLIGEGQVAALDCDYPWYRLAPSAHALGENLANDLAEDGYSEIAILYGSGEYDTALRTAVRNKFEGTLLRGTVLVERSVEEGKSSYTDAILEVLEADPQAIVLSASPQTGAVVFTEANLIGVGDATWALSPLLKTPLFLQNINAEDAEGALGVAPRIVHSSQEFPKMFGERWLEDQPLEGAYFYFDSVNLLAIAFGLLDDVEEFTFEELKAAVVQASSSRGVSVDWDQIDEGLEQLADGVDAHYSGLTGPILLQECGNRRSGLTQAWSIQDGEIEVVNR